MTNKQYEARAYLSNLRYAEKMIQIKLEKIEETRELALRINYVLKPDRVQGGRRVNIVEETALKVVELTKQLEKQVDEYRKLQKRVFELIDGVDNEVQQKILELRYIHFMKWEKIADIMNYTRDSVMKNHVKGLNQIANNLNL